MLSLNAIASALGGEVRGNKVVCPGFGHSRADRSLAVWITADGRNVRVDSKSGDDVLASADAVREQIGLPLWRAGKRNGARRIESRANGQVGHLVDDGHRTSRALPIWSQARQPAESPVERYLTRRGLNLVDNVHEVIRFHPSCPFAGTRTRAMVALVRNIVTNTPQAVHRTALSLDGRKIEVDGKDRLALGPIGGGAVKVTADENVTTCLGVAEGIETALSLQLLPEFGATPVWSLLNAGGIATFPVLAGVECLWIAVDHDPAGIAAADLCADRWRRAGREVFLVRATTERADLNDVVWEVRHG